MTYGAGAGTSVVPRRDRAMIANQSESLHLEAPKAAPLRGRTPLPDGTLI